MTQKNATGSLRLLVDFIDQRLNRTWVEWGIQLTIGAGNRAVICLTNIRRIQRDLAWVAKWLNEQADFLTDKRVGQQRKIVVEIGQAASSVEPDFLVPGPGSRCFHFLQWSHRNIIRRENRKRMAWYALGFGTIELLSQLEISVNQGPSICISQTPSRSSKTAGHLVHRISGDGKCAQSFCDTLRVHPNKSRTNWEQTTEEHQWNR